VPCNPGAVGNVFLKLRYPFLSLISKRIPPDSLDRFPRSRFLVCVGTLSIRMSGQRSVSPPQFSTTVISCKVRTHIIILRILASPEVGMFISFDFSPRGSLQYEIVITMECIRCQRYFAPSCDACWMAYWSRVAQDFREDGSRPQPSLARNPYAARLRVSVCIRTGARKVEIFPASTR